MSKGTIISKDELKRLGWSYQRYQKSFDSPSYEVWSRGLEYMRYEPREQKVLSVGRA